MIVELIFQTNSKLNAGEVQAKLNENLSKLLFPVKIVSVTVMGKWLVVLIEIPVKFSLPPYELPFVFLADEVAGLTVYLLQDYGVRYLLFEVHGITSSLILKKVWRIPEHTIALNCVVKDEAPFLSRFLSQIRPFVDEMVVIIDSRTTDASAEVALKSGARVFYEGWKDDFSLLWNRALGETLSEWVLILAVDEEPTEELLIHLRELINSKEFDAHVITIKNQVTKNEVPQVRLFRKGHWEGKVHEIVRGIPENRIKTTQFVIEHYQRWLTQDPKTIRERNAFYRSLEKDAEKERVLGASVCSSGEGVAHNSERHEDCVVWERHG